VCGRKFDLCIDVFISCSIIMENITVVKPKKFALPRFYVRNSRAIDTMSEMTEDLSIDGYVVESVSTSASGASGSMVTFMHDAIVEQYDNDVDDDRDLEAPATAILTKTTKATRTPTAYNIFIKKTCEELMTTHVNMTPRERYALAIQMWKDRKGGSKT